jgi:CTP synthase
MLEYKDPENKMGGTMRLGLRPTHFVVDESILKEKYGGESVIHERHRHRYEINPEYIERLEAGGLRFVGKNDDFTRMEILELDTDVHPYFAGVQYHPEYLSRPFKPSPPYVALIEAGLKRSMQTNGFANNH